MKVPCKNCTTRYAGCHSKCEKYAEYRREIDKRNEFLKSSEDPRKMVWIKMALNTQKMKRKGAF